MSTTNGTTPAPRSATTRKRRKVRHLWLVEEGLIAAELGVDLRRFCGVWGPPPKAAYAAQADVVPVVEGVPTTPPRTCGNCARVYAAVVRREFDRRARAQRLLDQVDELMGWDQ